MYCRRKTWAAILWGLQVAGIPVIFLPHENHNDPFVTILRKPDTHTALFVAILRKPTLTALPVLFCFFNNIMIKKKKGVPTPKPFDAVGVCQALTLSVANCYYCWLLLLLLFGWRWGLDCWKLIIVLFPNEVLFITEFNV